MGRRNVSFPLLAVLLAVSVPLVGLTASPTVGAGGGDAIAAKKKTNNKKKKKKKKKYAPIRGKLSKRGYTVIALNKGGGAKIRRVKRRKFRLRPPAGRVTLHLRAPNGRYAGPIVLRSRSRKAKKSSRAGRKAILGVKAGARLGRIKIKPGAGYALAKGVAGKWLDSKASATAHKGVPIGARNFGRVRVRRLRGGKSDRDRDGIPTSLDIDDDGDLILDDIDPDDTRRGARASAAQAPENPAALGALTSLVLGGTVYLGPGLPSAAPPVPVVNANAPGLSEDQIQSGLRNALVLQFYADNDLGALELNCGGLVYCSQGGTGRRDLHLPNGLTPNPDPFPECCDPDHDGLGSLQYGIQQSEPPIFLQPRAGADQIRGGDLLIGLAKVPPLSKDTPRGLAPYAGQKLEVPFTLKTVFATPPSLASYTDELGVTHAVPYPYSDTKLRVVDGPDPGFDVSVALNFWRPQRRPVPDEVAAGSANWVDVGGLQYWARTGTANCPQSAFSALDPDLRLTTVMRQSPSGPEQVTLLIDSAPDRAATQTNTFSYTLNLNTCLEAAGEPNNLENFNTGFAPAEVGIGASPVPTEGQPPAQQLVGSTFFFSK